MEITIYGRQKLATNSLCKYIHIPWCSNVDFIVILGNSAIVFDELFFTLYFATTMAFELRVPMTKTAFFGLDVAVANAFLM